MPRSLVTLNSRSVLTDSQGRFEFPAFTDAQAFATIVRPGFTQTLDLLGFRPTITDLDSELTLKIYPDAVIAGTVTGGDGLPLTHIQVQLRRASYDANGARWQTIKTAQTDSRGEYRFQESPGRYRLAVGYTAKSRDTGDAVIPLTFPEASASDGLSYFNANPAEEKRIDLRPRTGHTYPVRLAVDPPEAQRGMQLRAVTSNGESFPVSGRGQNGDAYEVQLPAGTYQLRGHMDNHDSQMDGVAKVTVSSRLLEPVTMHFAPETVIPVEMAVDLATAPTSSGSGIVNVSNQQQPDLRFFNLHLHNDAAFEGENQDIPLHPNADKTYELHAPPGRYRLEGNLGGMWFIQSASVGVTNLFNHDLVIAPGAAAAPIHLVASNATGFVQGTVNVGATTDPVWVYYFPHAPALAAINPTPVNSTTGHFAMNLPAGSYMVVAVDHRLQEDLRDPALPGRFSTGAQTVEITTGNKASVTLDVATLKEAKQ